jgi:GNAT superfamily N-acetyltransferase
VGVEKNDEPIGLGLMQVNGNKAYILSLCIDPQHRGNGLGRRLLATLEAEIIKRNVCQAEFVYETNKTTPKLERILELQNWSKPRLQKLKDLSPYVAFSCRFKKTFKNF